MRASRHFLELKSCLGLESFKHRMLGAGGELSGRDGFWIHLMGARGEKEEAGTNQAICNVRFFVFLFFPADLNFLVCSSVVCSGLIAR